MVRKSIPIDAWQPSTRLPPMNERADGWTESLEAYVIVLPVSGLKIVVPRNFLHNWSSVPWFATWLVPRRGPYARAGFVHDWLFCVRGYQRVMWDRTWPDWVPRADRQLSRMECNDEWSAIAEMDGARAYSRVPGRLALEGLINRWYWNREGLRPWTGLVLPGHPVPVFSQE